MSIYHAWVWSISSLDLCISFEAEPKILCEVGAEAHEDEEEGRQDCDRLTFFPVLNETPAVREDSPSPCTPEPCSNLQDCPDIRIILQELHPGEEVCWYARLKTTCLNTRATPSHPVNIHNPNYLM